jgi:hypothetical protein
MKRILLLSALAAACIPGFAFADSTQASRFALTLRVIGPGAVASSPGASCAGYLTRVHLCRRLYTAGTHVKLTAFAKVDAKLSSWRGSASGRASAITVTMDAPKVITATFAKVPPSPLGSRTNPVPLGQPVNVTSFGEERWTLRIISTRPDATAAVLAENQFNEAPSPGNQFFVATVVVSYVSGSQAEDAYFSAAADLRTVGPSNVVYSSFGPASDCGVVPDDLRFKGELLPGGSMTGNLCWQVPSSEARALVAFVGADDKPYYLALR